MPPRDLLLLRLLLGEAGKPLLQQLGAAVPHGALQKLERLVINDNWFGDQGVAALAPALRKLPALKKLHLYHCAIGDDGVDSLVGNLGKVMLTNTLIIWGTCAASPFDDELKYRIIRAASIMMVFFLGSFSKDSIVNLTTGWAEDMRTPTFVQNFVVTYYVLNCWASADFKLKAK